MSAMTTVESRKPTEYTYFPPDYLEERERLNARLSKLNRLVIDAYDDNQRQVDREIGKVLDELKDLETQASRHLLGLSVQTLKDPPIEKHATIKIPDREERLTVPFILKEVEALLGAGVSHMELEIASSESSGPAREYSQRRPTFPNFFNVKEPSSMRGPAIRSIYNAAQTAEEVLVTRADLFEGVEFDEPYGIMQTNLRKIYDLPFLLQPPPNVRRVRR